MSAYIHEGEQAVQRKAGEGDTGWGSPMFGAEIPTGFHDFMREQRLVAISGSDRDGAIWSTVLGGEEGFVDPVDDRNIVIRALPPAGDPLYPAFDEPAHFGMVVMSPQTLRRVKVNGIARRDGDGLVVRTEQVLGNCPKYLQLRTVSGVAEPGAQVVRTGTGLSAEQRRMIEAADTFFIGSLSPAHGADANHRGGLPGFVTVIDAGRLAWPDYIGNSFYMTLGNIELNPRCGLVFLDWETGRTLQLSGTARIDWNAERAEAYPGALRTVEFDVAATVEIDNASRLRWTLHGYSRFSPPPPATAPGSALTGSRDDRDH